MKSILASAEIRFFTQATEDEERVLKTVSETLRIPEERFERSKLTGHFGNQIVSFRVHLTGGGADRFAEGLALRFKGVERESLRHDVASQIDEHGALYLRIDKQSLFSESLRRSQIDAVKIRLKLRFKAEPAKMVQTHLALLTRRHRPRIQSGTGGS